MKKPNTIHIANLLFGVICYLLLLSPTSTAQEVIINEISATGTVELKNVSAFPVDVSDYWLYNFPTLRRVGELETLCDTTFLQPNAIMAVEGFVVNPADGELALYKAAVFNAGFMEDYVEWGSHGHFNANIAKAKGIWTNGDFVFPISGGGSIEYRGAGNASTDWQHAASASLCETNVLSDNDCLARGGDIVTGSETSVCADNQPDLVNVFLTDEQGDSTVFLLLSSNNTIDGILSANPISVDNGVPGIRFIRALTWTGTLQNLQPGLNLNQLEGCFQLSNIIEVSVQRPNGGVVLTSDDDTSIDGCADYTRFTMRYQTPAVALDYYYILTTNDDFVVASYDAKQDSVIEIINDMPRTLRVHGLSGSNIFPPPPGTPLLLVTQAPCRAKSPNFVTVRLAENSTVASEITSVTRRSFCASEVIPDIEVTRTPGSQGNNLGWLILNDQDSILALPQTPPFIVDTFGVGSYFIHSISYQNDVTGLEVGNTLGDVRGCFNLSNAIDIHIQVPDAGSLTAIDGGDSIIVCSGNAKFDLLLSEHADQLSYFILITDNRDSILEVIKVESNPVSLNLSDQNAGTCRIYGWSQSGSTPPRAGLTISELPDGACEDLSADAFIVFKTPNPNRGGSIASGDPTSICLDENEDELNLIQMGNVGDNSLWILTDTNGLILDTNLIPPLDLNNGIAGIFNIYNITYSDDIDGLHVGETLDNLRNCFDLSNPITIRRDSLDGGILNPGDTVDTYTFCQGGAFINVRHQTTMQYLYYHYVLATTSGIIRAVYDPADGPLFNLSLVPAGSYRLYGWAHADPQVPPLGISIGLFIDGVCEELSINELNINILPSPNNGGVLTTNSNTTICVDGEPDEVDLTLTGNSGVVRIAYIITDENFNILDIPQSNPPFNLDDGNIGTVFIWNIAHNGALQGLEIGNNIVEITGCYDLSNPIQVNKVLPDAGRITTSAGETSVSFCAGSINLSMQYETSTPAFEYYYLVTDAGGTILQAIDAKATSSITINAVNQGLCRIYGFIAESLPQGVVGFNIINLEGLSCTGLTPDFVTVNKLGSTTEGGILTSPNLEVLCSDGIADPISVNLSGALGVNMDWIITDEDGIIIGLPFAPPFNLDAAGAGNFFIYNISYEDGLTGLSIFNNLSDLRGCFDLSNGIQVTNQAADAGQMVFTGSSEVCIGDISALLNVAINNAVGEQFAFIITDLSGTIQALSSDKMIDVSSLSAGVYRVQHLAYSGSIFGLVVGQNINDLDGCFDLSNTLAFNVTSPAAGIIQSSSGSDLVTICPDGNAIVNVQNNPPGQGLVYRNIVTTVAGIVLSVQESSQVQITSTESGTCRIYGWIGRPEITINTGDQVQNLDEGCAGISTNFITVRKERPAAGNVVNAGGNAQVICESGNNQQVRLFNTSNITGLLYAYIAVDANGVVRRVSTTDFVDFNGLGNGTYRIYGHQYSQGNAAAPGDALSTIGVGRCDALTSNFITIIVQSPDGGFINSDVGGQFSICLNDEPDNVLFSTLNMAPNLDYTYLVVDASQRVRIASESRLINLNDLPIVGEYRVFGWSHESGSSANVGTLLSDLEALPCSELSTNTVSVTAVTEGGPCIVNTLDLEKLLIKVYPNPTKDFINISWQNSEDIQSISLYNITGQEISASMSWFPNRVVIEGSALSRGPYYVKIRASEGSAIVKVLLQ